MKSHHVRIALLTVLGVVVVARIAAIFTLNVNWDEFALLQRAVMTARTGALEGGGRPGLATLVLVPFAAACRNAVDAVVQARVLWTGIVAASAAAFWLLLREVIPPSPHRRAALTTGLGLWVLAPPFLHSSTQVRTDQPAILFGLLGGLVLLTSRAHTWRAAVAGLLFGIGFLFSQKLLYVGGLVMVLTGAQLALRGGGDTRQAVLRAGLAGTAFLTVVLGYSGLMARVGTAPPLMPLGGALSTFQYYRDAVGWEYYTRMLPLLLPHGIMIGALAVLTMAWLGGRRDHGRDLGAAWAVIGVGLVVLLVHAGRFPYFHMTLGLFPAAAGGLLIGPLLNLLHTPVSRRAFLALVWVPLLVLAVVQAGAFTLQMQQHQRESLHFVERNFSAEARGFGSRAEFACRQDPNPFPVRFGEHVDRDFGSDRRSASVRQLLEQFRDRPVAYMVPPGPEERYPRELREFWRTRYVHYYGAVHVPGRRVSGGSGWSGSFEVIVPGEYVWRSAPDDSAEIEVSGTRLRPGDVVFLPEQEIVRLRLPAGGAGMLALNLGEPPAPDTTPFYRGF